MIVDTGKVAINAAITYQTAPEEFDFCLYTNAITWAHDTSIGDLTEAAWASYARQNIPAWATPTIDGSFNGVSEPTTPNITFDNGEATPQVAVGFFVVGHSSGILYGGDAFSWPIAIDAMGSRDFAPSFLVNTLP